MSGLSDEQKEYLLNLALIQGCEEGKFDHLIINPERARKRLKIRNEQIKESFKKKQK